MSEANSYDGFYVVPKDATEEDEDDSMELMFFCFKEDEKFGVPIENNEIGFKYHVAFFKERDDGEMILSDCFEAIFADPVVYAKGLLGSKLFGTFIRKTEKSSDWFDDYLKKVVDSVRMVSMAKSISES
jgi:hypothetical protein